MPAMATSGDGAVQPDQSAGPLRSGAWGESCYLIPVEIVYARWWSGLKASNAFSFLRARCSPEGGYEERSHAASRHDGDSPADPSSTAAFLTAVLITSSLPVLHGVPFFLVLATDRCAAREPAGSPTKSSLVKGGCYEFRQ